MRISPDSIQQTVFDFVSKPTTTAVDVSSSSVGERNGSYAEMTRSLKQIVQLVIRHQRLGNNIKGTYSYL